jgi:hypothetical protein
MLIESKWNTMKIGSGGQTQQSTTSSTITSHVVSTSWFNKVVSNDGTRLQRLKNYYAADTCSVEIARALDIIAEDVSAMNAGDTDNRNFFIEFNDDKVKKTIAALLNDALDLFEERTALDEEFYDRVRKTLRYGSTFYRKNPDGTLSELPTERFVGYILSETDETKVTHYLYDPTIERIDKIGRSFKTKDIAGALVKRENKYETIDANDMVIFKLGDKPFGESIIERVYSAWKTMKLLEDSIVIYRVTRSSHKNVFYIDTGNLQGAKKEQAIMQMKRGLSQKKVNRNNDVYAEYDPNTMQEDYFIPTSGNGRGSRVEQLQGAASMGELPDLEWFKSKLSAGLRIPMSMLDTGEQGNTQYADMRVGQLYSTEMRYLGYISRIKRRFRKPIEQLFREFCNVRGITFPEKAQLMIQESHSFSKYKQMELNQTSLNIFNSTLQISQLSKKVALAKYLDFTPEELRENEEAKLAEKGIDPTEIKKMTPVQIDNIVYGDGRLGADFGLEPAQQGQGW